MTAPVKAIFATLTDDVVGLRCRPLMGALNPLYSAHEVSCRVRAGEVARPASSKRRRLHPKESQAIPGPLCSVDRWVPRLHPSCLALSRAPTDGARRGWSRRAIRYGSVAWD